MRVGVLSRITAIAVMLLRAALPVLGQEGGGGCIPVRSVAEEDLAFEAGEVMKFTLHYKWGAINADVGSATVRLDSLRLNGVPVFLCDVFGRTTRFFDVFFKVRERFMSWFTRDGLRPLRFTRTSSEGSYSASNDYVYMWDGDEGHIDADVFSTSAGRRSLQIPISRCVADLPALFFLARNIDLSRVAEGRKYPMSFVIDDEVYNVYFILQGREEKKIKGVGTVRAVRFAARLLAGEVFTGKEDMTIWVSDDENRVPVYFEAPLIVGSAAGRITECTGLRHPSDAFIKN